MPTEATTKKIMAADNGNNGNGKAADKPKVKPVKRKKKIISFAEALEAACDAIEQARERGVYDV